MKHFAFVFLLSITSLPLFSASLEIDETKISSPECTKYLMEDFNMSATEAYQICSNKTEEKRSCLVENHQKTQEEINSNCYKK